MALDFGDDACVALKHALEHEVVLERLIAGDDASTWGAAVTDAEVLQLPLRDLRARMVTPDALSLRDVTIHQLAKAHGLPALLEWGLQWRHLLALGFTRGDLGSLDAAMLRAMDVRANDLLELRPRPRDLVSLRLSAADMKRMGCGDAQWVRAMGYDAVSMRAHKNLSLRDWDDVLGPRTDWAALGFTQFDACVKMGWDGDELYSVVFKRRAAAAPGSSASASAPPVALSTKKTSAQLGRLTMPGTGSP